MKRAILLCGLLMFMGAACMPRRQVEGQVFLVDDSLRNIPLGLVSVYVIDEQEVINVAERVIREGGEFHRELDITGFCDSAASGDFWASLPASVARTDAEGRFRVAARAGAWVLARTHCGVHELAACWVHRVEGGAGDGLLFSVDNQLGGAEASREWLESFSGIGPLAATRRSLDRIRAAEEAIADAEMSGLEGMAQAREAVARADELEANASNTLASVSVARALVAAQAVDLARAAAVEAAARAAEARLPALASSARSYLITAQTQAQQTSESADESLSSNSADSAKSHAESAEAHAESARKAANDALEMASEAADLAEKVRIWPEAEAGSVVTAMQLANDAAGFALEARDHALSARARLEDARRYVAVKVAVESALEAALEAVRAKIKADEAVLAANDALKQDRISAITTAAVAAARAAEVAANALRDAEAAEARSTELTGGSIKVQVRKAENGSSMVTSAFERARKALGILESEEVLLSGQAAKAATNSYKPSIVDQMSNSVPAAVLALREGKGKVDQLSLLAEQAGQLRDQVESAETASMRAVGQALVASSLENALAAESLLTGMTNTQLSLAERGVLELREKFQVAEIELLSSRELAGRFDLAELKDVVAEVGEARARAAAALVGGREVVLSLQAGEAELLVQRFQTNEESVTNLAAAERAFQAASSLHEEVRELDVRIRSEVESLRTARAARSGDRSREALSRAWDIRLHGRDRLLDALVGNISEQLAKAPGSPEKLERMREARENEALTDSLSTQVQASAKRVRDLSSDHETEASRSAMREMEVYVTRAAEMHQASRDHVAALQEKMEEALSRFRESMGEQALQSGARLVLGDVAVRWIDPGSFTMGSPGSEEGRDSDEVQHEVTLTQGFFMAETECTQEQWASVMGGNPSSFKGSNLPVERVSWDDAVKFCRKLTEKHRSAGLLPEGWEWRLPTEAQWEYACRAGSTGARHGELDAIACYGGNPGSQTHPVGMKQANAWGLHDMVGNVWEWCADWYGDYPSGSVTDPTGANSGPYLVFRGGSWGSGPQGCRSAKRLRYTPGIRNWDLGFRPALVQVR